MSHREWLRAHFARQGLKPQWARLFRDFDVVICPPAATQAFQHDHSTPQEERKLAVDGKEVPYLHQLAWAELATTCGRPATVVPLGVGEGLPSGVQIIGPHLEDRTPLAFARAVERELPASRPARLRIGGVGGRQTHEAQMDRSFRFRPASGEAENAARRARNGRDAVPLCSHRVAAAHFICPLRLWLTQGRANRLTGQGDGERGIGQ